MNIRNGLILLKFEMSKTCELARNTSGAPYHSMKGYNPACSYKAGLRTGTQAGFYTQAVSLDCSGPKPTLS